MSIKVLHLIESSSGGSFEYVVNLTKILDDMGYNQSVVYSRREDTLGKVDNRFDSKIKCHEISMKLTLNNLLKGYGFFHLRKLLKKEKPNILHCHSSLAGMIGRVSALGLGFPVVYTPHGFAFKNSRFSRWSRFLFWLIEWLGSRLPCFLLAVSKTEMFDGKKLGFRDRSRLVLTGVPIQTETPRKLNFNKEFFTIVTLGRIVMGKNPNLFADIKSFTDNRFKWIWIGDGPESNLLIERGVDVTGWVDNATKYKYLNEADIYVSTSKSESMPLSVLEAMSFGLPCVVSHIDAHLDIISNGNNGLIAAKLQDFIKCLDHLIENEEFYSILSYESMKTIRLNYNLDIYAKDMHKSYKYFISRTF